MTTTRLALPPIATSGTDSLLEALLSRRAAAAAPQSVAPRLVVVQAAASTPAEESPVVTRAGLPQRQRGGEVSGAFTAFTPDEDDTFFQTRRPNRRRQIGIR